MKMNKIYNVLICLVGIPLGVFSQVGNNTNVLNPNRASVEELGSINGIDNKMAESIIGNRSHLGMIAFDEFLTENGVDEKVEIYKKLFLPINLNTATRTEIMMVPSIGNKMAHEFEEYRPYKKMIQWRREMAKYIDDDEIARFEQYVFVPINLNTATDEEILSIPGIGSKMLHEFKEYRPYQNIDQFRREIGKYVSEDEVARFERYVTLD